MRIVLLFAFTAAVAGQTTEFPNRQAVMDSLRLVFNILDANEDGELTQAEQETYFDSIDTDGDGRLSYEEYVASRAALGGSFPSQPPAIDLATFDFYDTLGGMQDADGFLARDDTQYFFALLDGNGDGQANLREFDEAFLQIEQSVERIMSTVVVPLGK